MRKPLFNLMLFIIHIISFFLLVLIYMRFEMISFSFDRISKESVITLFKNDYVVNIICTVLTAVALYFFQIDYSKHKLKSDFRCNEIIHDVYDGIEITQHFINEGDAVSNEIKALRNNSALDSTDRRKE